MLKKPLSSDAEELDTQETAPCTATFVVEFHVNPSALIHGALPAGFVLDGILQTKTNPTCGAVDDSLPSPSGIRVGSMAAACTGATGTDGVVDAEVPVPLVLPVLLLPVMPAPPPTPPPPPPQAVSKQNARPEAMARDGAFEVSMGWSVSLTTRTR
jgi:hypothetical protein